MQVLVNQVPIELPPGSHLAQAIAAAQTTAATPITGPFAAAVNLRFVPKAQYPHTALQDGDQIELIAPVTGG